MPKQMIRIHNVETDEIIDREMTADELAKREADITARAEIQAEKEAKETTKAALLDRLGITAEEAVLLLS